MESRGRRKIAILPVLALFLLLALVACGGGKTVPSDSAAKKGPLADKGGDDRFIAQDEETVLDTKTNLIWAAKDNGTDISYTDAKSYVEKYRGGGHKDWRMPTQDELLELYDEKKSRPAPCDRRFKVHIATDLIQVSCVASWSSEVRGSDAAYLSFGSGRRYWGPQSSETSSRVLPVRSVQ